MFIARHTSRRLRGPATLGRSERGATAVETAITIGLFLLIVGGGIEMMRLAYNALTLQIVAITAMRSQTLGSCGGCTNGLCSLCTSAQRANAVEDAAKSFAAGLGLSIGEQEICIRPANSGITCNAGGDNDDAGGPKQMIVITITRRFSLFFGLGQFTVQARAIGKNEPFGTGVL